MEKMRVVDLFCGCGGLSLGFERAGFELVCACDNWIPALKTYMANFNHDVKQLDLSDVDLSVDMIEGLKPDVIIGGPPCQDFSHAGKRIEADRAELTFCFSEIVKRIRPPFFVMENVDRARNSKAYADARANFKSAGYGLTEIVLDASLCGVPQKRKRFIVFGALNEEDNFAEFEFKNRQSKEEMTLRRYFGDLGFEFYYRHPRNYSRRAVFSVDEPAPTMRGVNRPIPKGYPGHPNDAAPISPSVHVLTTQERAMIQTFPKDYKWIGNKTEVEQMVGNAVPVGLAYYVARIVSDEINKKQNITH